MEGSVGEPVPMGRTCAWCSHAAPMDATTCPSCGAALAQRETIGDLVIPGLTDIRPDLLDADGRPLHIPVQSNAQGLASGAMVGAMIGGPVGLAAIGGTAAVAAVEYLSASRRPGDAPAFEDVGRPSDIVAEVARRLDRDAERPSPDAPDERGPDEHDPWRDLPR